MESLIAKISQSVSTAHTVEQLTRPLLEMLTVFTGLESTYLTSIDELQGVQHVLFAHNVSSMQIPEGLTVPWGDTLCKRALEEGRTFTNDVPACWGDSDAAQALGIHTYVSTPVRMEDGSLYGTLCAASAQTHARSPDAENLLTLFAALIGQQVQRELRMQQLIAANAQLASAAATDQLTGLPNRRALVTALERMLAQGRRQNLGVQVVFLDLDGFKAVNDTHGHEVGDQFLMAVAQRLRAVLRTDDVAARLGGDEFVVVGLTEHTGEAARAARDGLRERITQALIGHYDLGGVTIDYGGASVGVVTLNPDRTHAVEDALRAADQAMYQTKCARRDAQAALNMARGPTPRPNAD